MISFRTENALFALLILSLLLSSWLCCRSWRNTTRAIEAERSEREAWQLVQEMRATGAAYGGRF